MPAPPSNTACRVVACFLLALLLSSCAATLPYSTDYPLTEKIFRSRDGILTGKIPQGWFSSTEDSLASGLIAWLIQDNLSATLALKELKLDNTTSAQVSKQGLQLLARLSMSFQEELSSSGGLETKEFTLDGRKFCSYEFSVDKKKKRVVVFAAQRRYYLCEAASTTLSLSSEETARLFSAQQTVLSSLRF